MKTPTLTLALSVLLLAACGSEEAVSPSVSEDTQTHAAAPATDTEAAGLCLASGPQTPRDISNIVGENSVTFPAAPPASEMNLCNIHTHTNAEHKGPGFSLFVSDEYHGGYACNETPDLSDAELQDPTNGTGAFGAVKPGDTIEVHWVHTSCDVAPGEGLGACSSATCTDPLLRVEAQTFLVVNDPGALDFTDYAYGGNIVDGRHQAKAIPSDTGTPVQFLGSTTGPSYTQSICSPAQVTWNVRPQCARVDISSLHKWAESGNVFNETESHGVRALVTAPELLSSIE